MWRWVALVAAVLLLALGAVMFITRPGDRAEASPAAPQRAGDLIRVDDGAAPPEATDATREQKRFSRYDKDKDGKITREEYLAARHKGFAKLDTNGDGRLSFDEWAAKAIGKFSTADADHSAVLTPAEFATTAVKRKSTARPRCTCPAKDEAPAAAEDN